MKNLGYQLRELTLARYKYGIGACPVVYELVREDCGGGPACPAIYELAKEECCIGSCPTVYKDDEDNYFIIGKKVDPKEFGLEGKIGKDETLISIPKGLIEKLNK